MFKNLLRRIPYIEAVRALLEQWGLWQYISAVGGVMIAFVLAFWSLLESHLPFWGIGLVGLAAFTSIMIAAERTHALVVRLQARQIDIPKQAEWMKEITKEMRHTLSDLRAGVPPLARHQGESETDFHMREHMERMKNQRRIAAAFYQKHGGQVIAAYRIVQTVSEGEVPFHTKASLSYEPMTAVAYIDASAHLMAAGNIDEMKKMDSSFMFHLGAI